MKEKPVISRQQKLRTRMTASGKKQRTFFLTDAAVNSIKKNKVENQYPNLDHALEILLTSNQSHSQEIEKPVDERQQKIVDAAQRLGNVKRKLKTIPPDAPGREILVKEFTLVCDEIASLTSA